MARPKKYDIDTKEVEKLASYGCTNIEIASFFGCDESLIRKSYSEFITKGQEKGKTKLRKLQWKQAEKGNVPMLIWLGKQVLGQSDKQEIDHNVRPIDEIEFDGI
tara:strand:+ start:753 stop:1067 length:315 start_codon:yes stop_codon:yes gene_type:complete